MALSAITAAPEQGDFIPLQEHQEATPATFSRAKPVLHLHSPGARLETSRDDLAPAPEIAALGESGHGDQFHANEIDLWVTSSSLSLYSRSKSCGVQIPYQTITVHAQDGDAVLIGLNLSDSNTPDEDLTFIQFRLFPTLIAYPEAQPEDDEVPKTNGHSPPTPTQALFKAISDCQELNPDPPEEGDEDVFDETAPGATGWITSENMQDFVDENGELRMPAGVTVMGGDEGDAVEGALGAGAGRTRTADEVDGGDAVGEDDTKWQRTG